jgi:hypothetical protein
MKTFYIAYMFRHGLTWQYCDTEWVGMNGKFVPQSFKKWLKETFEHAHKADQIVILNVVEI